MQSNVVYSVSTLNCIDGSNDGKDKLFVKKWGFLMVCLQNKSGIALVTVCTFPIILHEYFGIKSGSYNL
jgi:hypothetical protein